WSALLLSHGHAARSQETSEMVVHRGDVMVVSHASEVTPSTSIHRRHSARCASHKHAFPLGRMRRSFARPRPAPPGIPALSTMLLPSRFLRAAEGVHEACRAL